MKKKAALLIGVLGSVVLSVSSVMYANEIEIKDDVFFVEDTYELEDTSVAGDLYDEDLVEDDIVEEGIIEDDSVYEEEAISETPALDFEEVELIEEYPEELFAGETIDPNIMVNGTYTVSTIEEAIPLLDAEYPNTIQLLDNVEGNLSIPSGTEVKLDLNGKRLTTTQITNAGTLNIIDSTSGKRGNVYYCPPYDTYQSSRPTTQYSYLLYNTGTLSITDASLILKRPYINNTAYARYTTKIFFIDNYGTCMLQNVKEIVEEETVLLEGLDKKYNTVNICGLRSSGTATVDGLRLSATFSVNTNSTSSLSYTSYFIHNSGTLNYLSGSYDIVFDKTKINPNVTSVSIIEYEINSRANGSVVNIGKDDGIVDGTSPSFKYGIWTTENDIVNLYDGDFSNIDTTLIGNIGYNAITYTVNFFTDESTLLSTNTVRFGDELDIPTEPVPPEHYTFEGWFEKNGGDYWDKATTFKKIYGNADYLADFQPIIIKQILFSDDEVTVKEGETFDLSQLVLFRPADYGSDDTVVWTSSNTSMATVDGNGVIKGMSVGKSTITVTLVANTTITASKLVTIEHNWDTDYTIDKEATCSEDGSQSIHCKVCGAIKANSSVPIPATHRWASTYTIDKEATCTEDGSKSIHCTVCDAVNSETSVTIPAAHKWSDEYTVDKEATCTEDGSKSIHCIVCGATKEGSSITLPASHLWETNYTVDVPAACTENGSESIHCSVCGETKPGTSRTIMAFGHHLTMYEEKAPTCTKAGNDEYYYCDRCHKYYKDENGVEEISLSEVRIAPYGHRLKKVEAKSATCAATGNIEYYYCSRCKEYFEDEECTVPLTLEEVTIPINSSAHEWNAGEQTTAPTCTENGVRTYTCLHDSSHLKTESISPIGHDWDDPVYTWANDNSTVTASRVCKHDSRHIESETKKTTYTVSKKATCTESGKGVYTVEFQKECFTMQLKEVFIPVTSHSVVTDPAVPATTTTTGFTEGKHCSVCGVVLVKQQIIPKLAPASDNSGVSNSESAGSMKSGETIQPAAEEAATLTVTAKGLKKNKVTIKTGKSLKLKTTSNKKVTFKTSNKKIATVSKTGKIKAKKKGKVTITVTAGNKKIKIKVTVK